MHLLVFCHLRWDFVHQRPQHLLSRLARHHKVLFFEEPLATEGAARIEVSRPTAGVEVLTPYTKNGAKNGGSGFCDDQVEALQTLLATHLRKNGITDYAVWFYTPMALPLLDGLAPRAVVYDCMDELSAFKYAPAHLREREAALMARADVVFTGGPSLYEARRSLHPTVLCLPSGVDAQHYERERATADAPAMARADSLQGTIGRPRLGFFGVIDERLDLQLLGQLASARPQWQFVMVGPVAKISADDLPRHANIHWLGQQPYAVLPQLVAGWDVCLLPFALNESTRFISPTKTLEYMAAGRPVVSTPVRDVAVLYGKHVRIANGAKRFEAACEQALAETPPEAARRLQLMLETVVRYSWDATAETMRLALEKAVATRRPGHKGRLPLVPRP
jgi:glycosyltransferase involved in cell wall biosynthesis